MKVETVVSSKEIIIPASPTPHFLRKHKFSFLDQISPCGFMSFVYFYPADGRISNREERSTRLKKSLSDILTRFYPLAGQTVDNLYVDCNDRGVEYFEAEANTKLSEFMSNFNHSKLEKFIPYNVLDVKDRVMGVQVTFFECGGMALGILISHKVGDSMSYYMFVNSWAAVARGETELPQPKFEAATIFPPRNIPDNVEFTEDEGIVKTFVFPESKIDELRDKYTMNNPSGDRPRRPSRIEALSTFIWSRFMATTQTKADPKTIYALTHVVNMRKRFDPPVSEDYFGNLGRIVSVILSEQDQKEGCCMVQKLREAFNNGNGEYVAKLQEGINPALSEIHDMINNKEKQPLVSLFQISSMCRFRFYEADFGWGKPIRVELTPIPYVNAAIFFDAKSGDGIEVWLILKEEDMAKFEADSDLRELITSKQLHYPVGHDQETTQRTTIPDFCSRL